MLVVKLSVSTAQGSPADFRHRRHLCGALLFTLQVQSYEIFDGRANLVC
jgi:hypothetical protein